ncbi:MAG: Rpp14/Pop5 family protein [Candidatus Njordarchaeales archaeon]
MVVHEKTRWVFFEVIGDPIEESELRQGLRRILFELFGTFGASQVYFRIVEYDPEKGVGILKVNLEGLPLLRVALFFLKSIGPKRIIINDLLVSGTIAALRRKIPRVRTWREYQSMANKRGI